jgi:hypothetical protein
MLLRLRLRAVSSRLCGLAIGAGLAAGLAVQLAAALILTPGTDAALSSGHASALMASASVAALVGAALAGLLAQRVGRYAALNAYASWAALSLILMIQIAATTDVLSV